MSQGMLNSTNSACQVYQITAFLRLMRQFIPKEVWIDVWMLAGHVNHPLFSLCAVTYFQTKNLLSLARPQRAEWKLWLTGLALPRSTWCDFPVCDTLVGACVCMCMCVCVSVHLIQGKFDGVLILKIPKLYCVSFFCPHVKELMVWAVFFRLFVVRIIFLEKLVVIKTPDWFFPFG